MLSSEHCRQTILKEKEKLLSLRARWVRDAAGAWRGSDVESIDGEMGLSGEEGRESRKRGRESEIDETEERTRVVVKRK